MSLFNRPAWATSSTSKPSASSTTQSGASPTNLFRHSSRAYGEIVAEQEQRRRRREEKREREEKVKEKKDNQRDGTGEQEDGDGDALVHEAVVTKTERGAGGSALKRRRITSDDSAALLESAGLGPVVVLDDDSDEEERARREDGLYNAASSRWSPRNAKSSGYTLRSTALGDEDAGVDGKGRSDNDDFEVTKTTSPTHDILPDDESDDEFAELARQARLERKPKSAPPFRPPDGSVASSTTKPSNITETSDSLPDPVIQLFISSPIPNTTPLIVHRKLSQRMQEIREAWCSKQGFTKDFAQDVFFIHRLHRIYDVTTCRSLGLEVDVFGNVTMRGAEGKAGVDKIHLEAVTEELYQSLREEREREAQRRATGECGSDGGEAKTQAAGAEEAQEELLIRIVLKSKDKEDFKLKVKPTTRFSRIITAYCRLHAPDRTIHLDFDGERLNPDDAVQDSEVSDMDCLDVHVV